MGSRNFSSATDVRNEHMEYELKESQQMRLRYGESAKGPTGL